jgi:apolipoprotein D and lipocalin family protein
MKPVVASVTLGVLLGLALSLAGCSLARTSPLPLAQGVDLERFMGSWYVIAATPTLLDGSATDAVEHYRRAGDGTIATTYTFRDRDASEIERHSFRGFVREGTGNAVWEMELAPFIRADYRITWLAPDYSRVVIGREKRDYAWIMARTPHMPEQETRELYAFLQANGYDTAKLRRVPHDPHRGAR